MHTPAPAGHANAQQRVALYSSAADPEVMQRHATALLHLCTTRGWTPAAACRTIQAVSEVLAAGEVSTVVAVAATPALVEAVAVHGGTLEVVRPWATHTTGAPPGLATALGDLVRAGTLSPDEAARLLHAAGPAGVDGPERLHRRARRPA